MLPVGFSAVGLTLCGLYRAWMGAEAAAPVVPEHVGASESDLTRRARIRSLFVAQVWLAVVYATIGSALAATDWGDPAGRVCGNLLILSGGILGLWACARAMTSNHSVPVVVGVVRQRTSSHGE
jgi:hypothetical protein